MKNNKKLIFYSVYEEKNNDLKLISQFDNLQQLSDHLQIKKSVLKVMITNKQKIKNNFIIFKDTMLQSEL